MEGMGKTVDFSFYKGRKVLVTGNTGFKGSWMSVVLLMLGAEVYLYFDLAEFPITARVDSRTTARPGDTVKFAFDVEKIHVFDKETEQVITN